MWMEKAQQCPRLRRVRFHGATFPTARTSNVPRVLTKFSLDNNETLKNRSARALSRHGWCAGPEAAGVETLLEGARRRC